MYQETCLLFKHGTCNAVLSRTSPRFNNHHHQYCNHSFKQRSVLQQSEPYDNNQCSLTYSVIILRMTRKFLFLPCHLWDLSVLDLLALPCFQKLPSLLVLQVFQVFQVHLLGQDYLVSQEKTQSQIPKSIPVFCIKFTNIFIIWTINPWIFTEHFHS